VAPDRNAASELDRVLATCRRQSRVIETLGGAISTLRTGAAALKAENADLRAENDRIRGADRRLGGDRVAAPEAVVRLPLDVRAPGAARIVVGTCLRDRVRSGVLAVAQLLISELVTNSVRHSSAMTGETLLVRVALGRDTVRLGVENPGCGGVIAPRTPDVERGNGFGLNLVQSLGERWGVERAASDETFVWVQLRRAPIPSLCAGQGAE
jgi:anti-sigma regulatory factor (Ser/Thr protein kinase)